MGQLSPCVKPQVMVVRKRPSPSTSTPPHCSSLWAMWSWSNNRALVKEERMPRSGGPLDSDLLISQALSCLRLHRVFSRLRVEITACRVKYSEGLPRPEPEASSHHQHTGHWIQMQPAVGQQQTVLWKHTFKQYNSPRMKVKQCIKGDFPFTCCFLKI